MVTQATKQATFKRRSSIKPLTCVNEPPWGVEPQTYALRELPSSHTPRSCRAFLHVKPFTVLNETAGRTPFRSTNGSTFDLAKGVCGDRDCSTTHGALSSCSTPANSKSWRSADGRVVGSTIGHALRHVRGPPATTTARPYGRCPRQPPQRRHGVWPVGWGPIL